MAAATMSGCKRGIAATVAAVSSSPSTAAMDGEDQHGVEAGTARADKRSRLDESKEADAQSPRCPPCPMIQLLGRDTGAQFVLCEMLDLQEIGRLQCTGRSWRRWLDEGTLGSNRLFALRDPSSLPGALSCVWVRRYAQRVQAQLAKTANWITPSWPHPCMIPSQLFALLAALPRVQSLEMFVRGPPPEAAALLSWPTIVASRLTSLSVTRREPAESAVFVPAFFRSLALLPQLTALHMDLALSRESIVSDLDFSALPRMKSLQSLHVIFGVDFRCNLQQAKHLASCTALTELDAGAWTPDDLSADSTLDCLSAFVHGRARSGAASLRKFELEDDAFISPAAADLLLSLTELECLRGHWSCTLTSDHWHRLSRFQRLQSLRIASIEDEQDDSVPPVARLQLDDPLTALIPCRALHSMSIHGSYRAGLQFRRSHAATLALLPALRSLTLEYVLIESLDPLSSAPALQDLTLIACLGLSGGALCLRSLVPALPHLTSLTLVDRHPVLSRAEAAPLNALLFARCPALRQDMFCQQLALSDASVLE